MCAQGAVMMVAAAVVVEMVVKVMLLGGWICWSPCRDVLRVPWRTVWRTWRRSARTDGVSFRVRMFALVWTGLDKVYDFILGILDCIPRMNYCYILPKLSRIAEFYTSILISVQ